MIELEVYAAGVRNPEKMMALTLELDVISGLRYKVDTNHDIIYMEFRGQVPTLSALKSLFSKRVWKPNLWVSYHQRSAQRKARNGSKMPRRSVGALALSGELR